MKGLFCANSTAIPTLTAASWSRIYSLEELRPVRRAILQLEGGSGPLWQLLLGPTADPSFKVNAAEACYVLTHLDDDLRTCWTTRQSQDPISMLRQWMGRQGWREIHAWCWAHDDAKQVLTDDANLQPNAAESRYDVALLRHTCRGAVEHTLREAWRAKLWHVWLRQNSIAATHLNGFDWPVVSVRAKKVARLWQKPGPDRPHIHAITANTYVSNLHLAVTSESEAQPCVCGELFQGTRMDLPRAPR